VSDAPAQKPRYLDDHLAEHAARAAPAARADLFIHLGHWDALAPGTSLADLRAAQQRTDDRLVGLAGVEDGLAILDAGCGFGGTIASLDAAATGLRLVGLNIDARQLSVAAASVSPRPGNAITWVEADACALPFEAASFDRVLAIECIFHFASRRRFLAEAARVLRAGGKLALSDLVPTEALARGRHELPPGLEEALHAALAPCPRFWGGEGTHEQMAAAAGLEVVSREDATLATLPSYSCILGGKLADFSSTSCPTGDRGVAALAWLQLRGLLRVEYWLFEKPETIRV
jgi:SAM-dependent methyltransferase